MSFSDCLQSVQQAQANLPTPGTVTIDTPEKKETVLTVPDGQVTVTCDANAGQATMTHN
jgi:hypothetical protein